MRNLAATVLVLLCSIGISYGQISAAQKVAIERWEAQVRKACREQAVRTPVKHPAEVLDKQAQAYERCMKKRGLPK